LTSPQVAMKACTTIMCQVNVQRLSCRHVGWLMMVCTCTVLPWQSTKIDADSS
jgi:hypothetical protein